MSDGALTASPAPTRQPLLRLVSDARLAKLAAQGNTAAFSAIYERHHQELYRYCRSILRNEHDARDALQNTMVKALRALEGETRHISVRPWLFRIAHNESITLLRQRTPDTSIDVAAEVAATNVDPESRERLRNLISDLELLTPRQRGALVMRELSGLEFEEIGEALSTSAAAAKQTVYEARLALMELEEGRELSCDDIRQRISAEDRRLLKGRRVRAHLKSCAGCRGFAEHTRERSGQLAALAPPLPVPIAMGILQGVIGGGGGGGIAALLGGGGAAGIGGATAAKFAVAGLIVLGAGAVAVNERSGHGDGKQAEAAPRAAESAASGEAGRAQAAEIARAGAGAASDPDGNNAGGKGRGENGESAQGNGNAQSGQAVAAEAGAPGAANTAPASNASSSSAANAHGANGNGPASTPPGQGGTPAGQGGTPPGLGEAPPGHGGTQPGNSTSAPGQTGDATGLGDSLPPGQGGVAPGQLDPAHGGGK